MVPPFTQEHGMEEPQILSLDNICMIDGSWTSTTQFSGSGWALMNSLGNAQFMGTRNYLRWESALHSEVKALDGKLRICFSIRHVRPLRRIVRTWLTWSRNHILGQAFQQNWKWWRLCKYASRVSKSFMYHEHKIIFQIRSFHKELYFIGCSISVWGYTGYLKFE